MIAETLAKFACLTLSFTDQELSIPLESYDAWRLMDGLTFTRLGILLASHATCGSHAHGVMVTSSRVPTASRAATQQQSQDLVCRVVAFSVYAVEHALPHNMTRAVELLLDIFGLFLQLQLDTPSAALEGGIKLHCKDICACLCMCLNTRGCVLE
eukprot:m.85526 g.85526  ORF g.85526 m.85526 type:complete len:155 (-) comp12781_c0_seq3:3185-3649(-)